MADNSYNVPVPPYQPNQDAAQAADSQQYAPSQAQSQSYTPSWAKTTGPYGQQPQGSQPNWTYAQSTSDYAQSAYTQPPINESARSRKGTSAKGPSGVKTFVTSFAGAALACVLAGGLAFGTGFIGVRGGGGQTTLGSQSTQTITAAASEHDSTLSEQVAAKVLPSIVAIDVYAMQSTGSYGWGWGGNSGGGAQLRQTGLGSGVIISSEGYILTNYHVVEGASKLEVTLSDGSTYEANVVGTDESSDLAVIKVNASNLTAIEIGKSDDLKVGEWVMTAGSPFGLEQSVATGIVSAVSRTITIDNSDNSYGYGSGSSVSVYPNMIQTDAAINPGNSGGALVNASGQLVGINSVIESYSGSYSGVGFAIPIDYAIDIATQIVDGKTPSHASLGVSVVSVNASVAKRYNLSTDAGAYVNAVYDKSAAAAAGLQEGDIITKLNDTKVSSSTDLIAAVRTAGVGSTVKVIYIRDGKEQTCEAVLGSDTDLTAMSQGRSSKSSADPGDLQQFFGGTGGTSQKDAA